jgi:DinB superfamily
MTSESRRALIDRYREGHAELLRALDAVTPEELDFRPGPAEWTLREIVHHVADSEMIAAIRLRRLLAEEAPVIQSFDQELYARRLRYDIRPIEAASLAIDAARRTTVELLDMLGEGQWQRLGTHTERGVYTPERWLELNAGHAHDHAEQIRRNRATWAARESLPSRGHAGSASDHGNIL